jgi:hypothetical protein
MQPFQNTIISSFLFLNLYLFTLGIYQSVNKKNSYGITPLLLPIGIFVWGDAVVFSAFWILVSLTTLYLNDWLLFVLTYSVFWVVRSLGESIFWFNQQFSQKHIYPPQVLPGYNFVKNESIWFIYQIITQCITVISLILSLYYAKLWLAKY